MNNKRCGNGALAPVRLLLVLLRNFYRNFLTIIKKRRAIPSAPSCNGTPYNTLKSIAGHNSRLFPGDIVFGITVGYNAICQQCDIDCAVTVDGDIQF